VHHGLFWNKDSYPIMGAKKKKIELLFQKQMSLLAYHLPLDLHQEVGNNWQAARDLGWEELEPFGIYNGIAIGVRGKFKDRSIDEFVTDVEAYYSHSATVALGGRKRVSSGALISGGAYKELSQAAKMGADCFITGNFDEPAWGIAFEENIHFLALGHTATEEVGPKALAKHLQREFNIPCQFIKTPNPF
jgi:putative NIF3 family GTP cyclohydrolase 1 type 2